MEPKLSSKMLLACLLLPSMCLAFLAAAATPAGDPTEPVEILRSFQTYYVKSGTMYLHRDVMQKALEQRPEFAAWHLKPGDDPGSSDLIMEITLPFLSWEWNYKVVDRLTNHVVGTGKVKALEQHQASTLLAAEITKKIQSVRGTPENAPLPPTRAPAALKKWQVKGATGPFQGKDMILTIGGESIFVSEPSGPALEIPIRSVLSAYHVVSENREKSRLRRKSWDAGWDKVCEATSGGDGCLAILGAPIWLIGDAVLMVPGPSSHFVAIRWQDDQAVNELSFQVGIFDWKGILRDVQAAVPKNTLQMTADMGDLRKEFEAAKQSNLKISLGSAVNIGRWPPLEAGDYRVVLVERPEARAEVFFFRLADQQFDKPRAVAAAHLKRISPNAATSTVTVRKKDGARLIDEIRADDVLLSFD